MQTTKLVDVYDFNYHLKKKLYLELKLKAINTKNINKTLQLNIFIYGVSKFRGSDSVCEYLTQEHLVCFSETRNSCTWDARLFIPAHVNIK